jgi:hypothetical protein
MLGGKYTDDEIRRRYTEWRLFDPLALVSFGVRGRWEALHPESQIHLRDPLRVGPREVTDLGLRNFAFDPTLAPAAASVMQATLSTDFDLWHDLHHAPRRYAEAKDRLAQQVLERLEAHAPGIAEAVEVTDVATPYTFWRYARSFRGSYEGFLPTAETMGRKVAKTLPGLARFYMAGQWVEPGGGIPPAVLSGRQAVQRICHEDDRPFVTRLPSMPCIYFSAHDIEPVEQGQPCRYKQMAVWWDGSSTPAKSPPKMILGHGTAAVDPSVTALTEQVLAVTPVPSGMACSCVDANDCCPDQAREYRLSIAGTDMVEIGPGESAPLKFAGTTYDAYNGRSQETGTCSPEQQLDWWLWLP